ncbi:head-tail adaptor protein [Mameliella alba]|uniref:head-tail adaptor protein n=1 Tax=Mameliella alba TaxID=561184 RepID=UPI000B534E12|nr:head-tail adaptor protein [Mameliella alba]MBY6120121.1 head-tail adaptor protein [Mameliella alba]OWV45794.1 phage tail protein [Mameliella alba]OWV64369.1 phage tail protein [Mameliella alba]
MSRRVNRRLVLEAPQRVGDGAGGFEETWTALGTLWAEVSPRTGRLARGETGEISIGGFKITVRGAPQGHSDRPGPGQRFRMGTRLFRIESVTEQEPSGLYLICECQEELSA